MNAYLSNDAVSSYVQSCIWLPFNPTNAFNLTNGHTIYVEHKYVSALGVYVDVDAQQQPTAMDSYQVDRTGDSPDGICPYLVLKDITMPTITNILNNEPNTNYEFYIPFVGWVKVDANKTNNKRLLIYYTMELTTGNATAYIYNYTDKYVIWSGTCQLGVKVDMTTTNQLENIRQKQANDTNMLLGLLSSALAIGAGVVTENPVALSGGILSAGKTLAGYVNANNQIYERAQMSFGSGDGNLYSNKDFKVMKITHEQLTIDNDTYANMQGFPYNNYVNSMSTLSGYVEIGEIHFNPSNNNIYQDEIEEIVSLLKDGVIF